MRSRILHAAFEEFYSNGFQAGSLNHIAAGAGATKGALFHYFKNKQDLGYAVIEEVIKPWGKQRWIDPMAEAPEPLEAIKAAFLGNLARDLEVAATLERGCPSNNLAQEMSPLDEGFRQRIEAGYRLWREALAAALERAKQLGQIRQEVSSGEAAALVVAAQMGIWGMAKNSRDKELALSAARALCAYLDGLKP